jgi:drug/metabolite transporter (DMT)-like permease
MKRSPAGVLTLSLIGISFAGPLTSLSHADPLVVAAWRLLFSLIIVAVALLLTGEWREWRRLTIRDAGFAAGAGIALAFHFWAWNASLHLTTIAASVTLVNMQPAFIVAISAVFLRESPTRKQIFGIGIAIVGALIIAAPAWAERSETRSSVVFGDMLALSSAVTAAIYYSIGRHLRQRFGLWSYVGLAYSACAITLLLATRATHVPMAPQPAREFAIFIALALGPMLLGHTGMNWALKYMPAYVVNLVTLGEPVGATLLAALLPGIRQIPQALTLAGGAVVLTGVYIAARGAVSTDKTAA